jgi:hypothetical protein
MLETRLLLPALLRETLLLLSRAGVTRPPGLPAGAQNSSSVGHLSFSTADIETAAKPAASAIKKAVVPPGDSWSALQHSMSCLARALKK